MKLVKLFLVIILSLSLISGTMVFADEVNEETVPNNQYVKSIHFLSSLNILQDYSENDADKNIKRSEFAKILTGILVKDFSNDEAVQTNFNDVNEDIAPSIYVVSSMGIMSGSNGHFRPDDNISYNEAIKALVSILGYTPKAKNMGGYPTGYLMTANDIGLLSGVKNVDPDKLTLGEVSKLIDNALKTDLMKAVGIGAQITYEIQKDVNLLSERCNIYKGKGMVTAAANASLYGEDDLPPEYAEIDDVRYLAGNCDVKSFLGHKVIFYYEDDKKAGNAVAKLMYMEDNSNVSTLTIKAEDIESYSDNKYIYFEGNDSNDKVKTAKIKTSANILYNGRIPAYPFDNAKFIPKDGEVVLVDNDSDSVYDVAFIWSFATYIVDRTSLSSNTIFDHYTTVISSPNDTSITQPSIEVKPDQESYTFTMTKDGSDVTLEELEKWNVLSVAKSDITEGKSIITIYVSDKKVTGNLEDYDEDEMTIDGQVYKKSSRFKELKNLNKFKGNPVPGVTYDFYLDYTGKVAAVDDSSSTETAHYGILISTSGNRGLNSTIKMKIYTEEGQFEVFETSEDVKLDGKKVDAKDLNVSMNNPLYSGSNLKRQLIVYKLNDNGAIRVIDTATVQDNGTDVDRQVDPDDSLTATTPTRMKYWYLTPIFNEQYVLEDGLKVFTVPATNWSIVYEDAFLPSYSVGGASFTDQDDYDIQCFNLSAVNSTKLLVKYVDTNPTTNANWTGPLLVINNLTSALNDIGDKVIKINGWLKNREDFSEEVEITEEENARKYQRGDIIQYCERQGKIYATRKVYDASGSPVPGYNINDIKSNARVFKCKVKNVVGNCYAVTNIADQTTGAPVQGQVKYLTMNSATVMKYNRKTNRVTQASTSDLAAGQEILVKLWTAKAEHIIIFEN